MKVLVICHIYPPMHNAGAEWYQHQVNVFLQNAGHEVRVMLPNKDRYQAGISQAYTFDGIYCFPRPNNIQGAIEWADVLISYLDLTHWAIGFARRFNRPLAWIAHNTHPYENVKMFSENVSVVYNSHAAVTECPYPNNYTVLHPPVDYRYYDVCDNPQDNEYITLINLNDNKGARQFYKLARRMPERKFLGVKGAYDEQLYPAEDIKNVTIVEHTADIREVYKKTRILLMPSQYESWGRTATEAMCNGIPVIANPTFGLKENLSNAGIYCDRANLDEWQKAIEKLDKKEEYKKASTKVRKRSRELDPQEELRTFAEWLGSLKHR